MQRTMIKNGITELSTPLQSPNNELNGESEISIYVTSNFKINY